MANFRRMPKSNLFAAALTGIFTLIAAVCLLLKPAEAALVQRTMAAGQKHSLAVRADGHLWAWGGNQSEQLGLDRTGEPDNPGANQVKDSDGSGLLLNVTSVAAGDSHSLALTSDGRVWAWAWGDNAYGQLGLDNVSAALAPVKVQGVVGAVKVAAGQSHSAVLLTDGTVLTWGDNQYGQLGNGKGGSGKAAVHLYR